MPLREIIPLGGALTVVMPLNEPLELAMFLQLYTMGWEAG